MMKMKKLATGFLAAAMMLSVSNAVFASDTISYTDCGSVTITKVYEAENGGTTSPAETFGFTIERTSVTDAAEGITSANMPVATIGSVSYAAGDAGSATAKAKDITITLPQYTSVGVYTYTIKETAGNTAGVTYYGNDILLKVTVIEQNGKVRVAAVHTESPVDIANGQGKKSDTFPNTYSAGKLNVKKTVTGNLGDQSKDFKVTVTFTAPQGKTVNEAISYIDGGSPKTIPTTAWKNGVATAEIELKHDETVTFTNIPYGVTYTVVEDDYTAEGYEAAAYSFNDANKTIDSAQDTVTITNEKNGMIDTGIYMDSLPYVLALALIFGFGAVLFIRRRRVSE